MNVARISTEIAVIGTGIVGIATAYYLAKDHGASNLLLIDSAQPMTFTSAQSGENYRNWWPHPAMVSFTNRSIDLLQDIACESGNRISMNRRGYALATRETDIDTLARQLHYGLGDTADALLRYHENSKSQTYQPPLKPDWENAPDGVDILRDKNLIRTIFPTYGQDVRTVIHIRRGGDISGQQLGMYMLEFLKEQGTKRLIGSVEAMEKNDGYRLDISTRDGLAEVQAEEIVNAAGPFAPQIAEMLDVELPVHNTFQQKIAFEDRMSAIPRDMPFSIDLDNQHIDWSADERELLSNDPDSRWLTEDMQGSIHCRPDGGDEGSWIKLGWAYNSTPGHPTWEPQTLAALAKRDSKK